jgi:hypothetical protein
MFLVVPRANPVAAASYAARAALHNQPNVRQPVFI